METMRSMSIHPTSICQLHFKKKARCRSHVFKPLDYSENPPPPLINYYFGKVTAAACIRLLTGNEAIREITEASISRFYGPKVHEQWLERQLIEDGEV
jgi:hypothetical protein